MISARSAWLDMRSLRSINAPMSAGDRSAADAGGVGGRISDKWQIEGFPTVYLLDHKGVIRYKGLRGEQLDKAIDRLLAELEAEKRSSR